MTPAAYAPPPPIAAACIKAHGLGCLLVHPQAPRGPEEGGGAAAPSLPLGTPALWAAFSDLRPTFPASAVLYLHLRAAGWVPRSGIKYGSHFILYRDHPARVHADYAVTLLPHFATGFPAAASAESSACWPPQLRLDPEGSAPAERPELPPSLLGVGEGGARASDREGASSGLTLDEGFPPTAKRPKPPPAAEEDVFGAVCEEVATAYPAPGGAGGYEPQWMDIQAMCRLNVQVRSLLRTTALLFTPRLPCAHPKSHISPGGQVGSAGVCSPASGRGGAPVGRLPAKRAARVLARGAVEPCSQPRPATDRWPAVIRHSLS